MSRLVERSLWRILLTRRHSSVYAWGGKSSNGHAVGQRDYTPMKLHDFSPASVHGVQLPADTEWKIKNIAAGVHHSLVVCENAQREHVLLSCGLAKNGQLGVFFEQCDIFCDEWLTRFEKKRVQDGEGPCEGNRRFAACVEDNGC